MGGGATEDVGITADVMTAVELMTVPLGEEVGITVDVMTAAVLLTLPLGEMVGTIWCDEVGIICDVLWLVGTTVIVKLETFWLVADELTIVGLME